MLLTCDEIRFPVDISRGSQGGPLWSTIVVKPDDGTGAEGRTPVWDIGKRRFEFAAGGLDRPSARTLMTFWYCRRGEFRAFRWKDWTDYQATDEVLEYNTDDDTAQLTKTYSNGGVEYVRNIYKPARVSDDAPDIEIKVNGVVFTYWAVDENSGMVYFTPGVIEEGDVITWTGEFDIPVCFDMGETQLEYVDIDAGNWDAMVVVEEIMAPDPVPADPPMLAPSTLTAEAIDAFTIDLTWEDHTSGETEFRIERSDDGLTGWVEIGTAAANATTYSDDTCEPETEYFYRVRAYRSSDTAFTDYTNTATDTTPENELSPLDLANLYLYLDAFTDFNSAGHNDPVGQWDDLSPNGYHLTAAGAERPTVQVSSNTSPTGKPLVRFDGLANVLSRSGPAGWPTYVGRGYTFYFYGRLKSSPGHALLFSNGNTGRPQIGYEKAAGNKPYIRTEASGTATFDLNNANIFDNKMQLFAVVLKLDGTAQAYRAFSEGAVVALSENPLQNIGGVGGLTGLALGASVVAGNGYCLMDLASVVWVGDEHNITTIGLVRNFLLGRYGED